MKKKYYKKSSQSKPRRQKNHYWLFLFLLVLGLATCFFVKQRLSIRLLPLLHGPHLSQALYKAGINQTGTLGITTKRPKPGRKTSPTPKILTPTPIPSSAPTSVPTITPTLTPTPTPTPSVRIEANKYGISAGGGLTYLGQTDLDLYFNRLKSLGVSWVRWDISWETIQVNNRDTFDWSGPDRVVQTANRYGISSLGIITYTPAWARKTDCHGEFACAPADPIAFGVFAGQVAARYASQGVHHWEIWNEPNIVMFWKPKPDVNAYTIILQSAYTNIKRVDPSAVVLSGGLASAGDENNNIAPYSFIYSLYDINIDKNFDGIAIHPYSYPALASYPAFWNCWQQIDGIRQLMVAHGDENKPLWLTEYGVATNGPGDAHEPTQLDDFVYGSDYMTENAQATMLNDALVTFSQLKGPVGPFFWYSLIDSGASKDTPENFFGLLRFDGSQKPAYTQFQSIIQISL
jgi:hypothetical protein